MCENIWERSCHGSQSWCTLYTGESNSSVVKLGDGGSEDDQCKEEPEYIMPTVQRPMLKRYLLSPTPGSVLPIILMGCSLTRYYHQWGVQVHGKHPKFPAKDEKVIYTPPELPSVMLSLRFLTRLTPNPTRHNTSRHQKTPEMSQSRQLRIWI